MTRAIHRASSTLNDLHEFKMDQFRSLLNDTLMPHVRVEYEEALANALRVFEEQLLSSSCECLHGATKVFLPAILDNKEALLSVMATKHDDDAFSNLKELAMAGKTDGGPYTCTSEDIAGQGTESCGSARIYNDLAASMHGTR